MKREIDTRIVEAVDFAIKKHDGQLDDNDEDYFTEHLWPVMMGVMNFTSDTEVIVASVLHDTIEDTKTTYKQIEKKFGKRVADLVNEVTCEGKSDQYGKYFPRLHSKEAILIKLIDRASNISRMDSWDEKRKKQYLKKTQFWKDGSDL